MISFSGVWVKIAHVEPVVSAFYRVFFGGMILFALALFRGEIRWRGIRHLGWESLCGGVFALDLAFYHHAITTVGPGLGTILSNFQVFILAGFGMLFLRERPRRIYLAAVPLAVAGLFLIVGLEWKALDATYKTGILFGLAAAFFYAAYILVLRRLQSEPDAGAPLSVLAVVSMITAIVLAADVHRSGDGFAIPDIESWMSLAALGLFSQVLGWILIASALPRMRASLAGLILLLQPALSFVWDVAFFDRPTSAANWLGVALTLTAIYLGSFRRR
ncbi:MAG: DMT family transporter [Desulfobacterales bacterium]